VDTMTKKEDQAVYSVPQVARILGIARNSAYEGIHRGEIPHIRVGGRILVPKEALDNLLRSVRQGDAAA